MKITGYDNLPIGKYQQVVDALRQKKDDIDAHASILAIIYDKTEDEVLNLPLQKYMELSENISFLMQPLPRFKGRCLKEYRIGDITLVPTTDARKFTAAQYIDYQTFIKGDGHLVDIASTLLVPKGCTYANGYDMADVHKAIAQMSVKDIAELSAFFLKKFLRLTNYSLICLELHLWLMLGKKESKKMISVVRDLRSFIKNGDGYHMFTQSPKQ